MHQNFEELQVVKLISAAKCLMQEQFAQGISAEQVAQELRLGYSWFRHLFKKFSGFAPNQYIMELKISKAKSLPTNTDKIIKEIAYECGFENQEYFCSIFKKKEDMPHPIPPDDTNEITCQSEAMTAWYHEKRL